MATPELVVVQQQSGMSFEKAIMRYLADGFMLVGQPFTLQGQPAQLVGKGDIAMVGGRDGSDGGGTPVDVGVKTVNGKAPDANGDLALHIPDITPVTVNKIAADTTTVTLGAAHKDKLNILRTAGEVVVTLPPNLGTDAKPYTAMIVNATGNMKVVGGSGVELVSFADVAISGVTLGLANTGNVWVVIGTSQASVTP